MEGPRQKATHPGRTTQLLFDIIADSVWQGFCATENGGGGTIISFVTLPMALVVTTGVPSFELVSTLTLTTLVSAIDTAFALML